MRPDRHVVDAQQRRAAVGQAEQALEADREVEVAAGVEPALRERLDAGQLALAQARSQVSASVPMTTSGRRLDTPLRTRAPCVVQRTSQVWPDVAQADVVGGVEAGLRAQVARRAASRNACSTTRQAAQLPCGPSHDGSYLPLGIAAASRPRREIAAPQCCGTIRLHDTPLRRAAPLEPREPGGRSGIYACGPTVYGRIHVGNARPFVVFCPAQALPGARGLRAATLVANVTDINDKIYDAARAAGARLGRAGRAR